MLITQDGKLYQEVPNQDLIDLQINLENVNTAITNLTNQYQAELANYQATKTELEAKLQEIADLNVELPPVK